MNRSACISFRSLASYPSPPRRLCVCQLQVTRSVDRANICRTKSVWTSGKWTHAMVLGRVCVRVALRIRDGGPGLTKGKCVGALTMDCVRSSGTQFPSICKLLSCTDRGSSPPLPASLQRFRKDEPTLACRRRRIGVAWSPPPRARRGLPSAPATVGGNVGIAASVGERR